MGMGSGVGGVGMGGMGNTIQSTAASGRQQQLGVSQQQQQQLHQQQQKQQQQQQQQFARQAHSNSNNLVPADKHGLLGLLHVIRMIDPDLTTLALGTDLTTLGLNLNSQDPLWKTFVSPWAEGPVSDGVNGSLRSPSTPHEYPRRLSLTLTLTLAFDFARLFVVDRPSRSSIRGSQTRSSRPRCR